MHKYTKLEVLVAKSVRVAISPEATAEVIGYISSQQLYMQVHPGVLQTSILLYAVGGVTSLSVS